MNKLETLQQSFKRSGIDISKDVNEGTDKLADDIASKHGEDEVRLALTKNMNAINETKARILERENITKALLESYSKKK